MKKILITGANSYIGISFEKYLKQWSDQYSVDTVDMIDGSWREKSFSEYNVIFHVAGIAHQKETKENAPLYYKINRDLAVEVASKAKKDGVKQFIFLSSMSIYGMDTGVITKETLPNPKSNYGKSKWQAEQMLDSLVDQTFRVCVLRPPMVYGLNCKGNFQQIVKLAKTFPVFPRIKNQRSMLYIENLCEFVRLSIERDLYGVFYPQNNEYINTSLMAKEIANSLNRKIHLSRLLGVAVYFLMIFTKKSKKAFGSLIYTISNDVDFEYNVVDVNEGIKKSI